jgi:hypothetical protein
MEAGERSMGGGTRFAIGILIMWLALVFFFFAFHPGGVQNVSNPGQMLQWLMSEFNRLTGGTSTTAATSLLADTGATQNLNYPGYTSSSGSDIGNANPSGVQLA